MRIFLLGFPGSGKGTQGELLSQALGLTHISLGDCVREILKTDSPLAEKIKASHSNRWMPLPDLLAYQIFLKYSEPDCIIDGFPRNIEQLKLLNPQKTDHFICLKISESESCDRILKRNRSDDAFSQWQHRIKVEKSRLPRLIEETNASIIQ